jgi:hypothetical protein
VGTTFADKHEGLAHFLISKENFKQGCDGKESRMQSGWMSDTRLTGYKLETELEFSCSAFSAVQPLCDELSKNVTNLKPERFSRLAKHKGRWTPK